jgi:hypothetical protein
MAILCHLKLSPDARGYRTANHNHIHTAKQKIEMYALSAHDFAIQQVSSTDQGLQLLEIVTSTKYTFVVFSGKLHNFDNHQKIITIMLLYLLNTTFFLFLQLLPL